MINGKYFKRTNETRIDATDEARSIFKFLNLKLLAESVGYRGSMFHQRVNGYVIDVGKDKRREQSYFTYSTLFKLHESLGTFINYLNEVYKEVTSILLEMDNEDPKYYESYKKLEERKNNNIVVNGEIEAETKKESELVKQ